MTSVIISGVNSYRGVLHGKSTQNMVTPLTPTEYIRNLGMVYDKYRDEINRANTSRLDLYVPRDDIHMKCGIIMDDGIASLKDIMLRASEMMKGRFFPVNAAVAFPVSDCQYRRITRELNPNLDLKWHRRLGDYYIDESIQRFVSADIARDIDAAFEINVIKAKRDVHRGSERMYLVAVDPRQIEDTPALVDDSLMMDCHILIVHPDAVSWISKDVKRHDVDQ